MIDYSSYYNPNARHPLASATEQQLSELLNTRRSAKIKLLQRYALEEVVRRHQGPPLAQRPLTSTSVLSIRGTVSFRNSSLKQQLASTGVAFLGKRVKPETTHVLLGVKMGYVSALQSLPHQTLVLEQDVQRFLDQKAQPYLQQAINPAWIDYLNDLILSKREADLQIALGLFEVAGFVPETMLAVILALKLTRKKTLKKALVTYVERYASSPMYHFFTLQYDLNTEVEKRLTNSIQRYTQDFPHHLRSFGLDLARLLYLHHKKGFLYLWHYSPDSKEIVQSLEDLCEGYLLDLSNRGITFLPEVLGKFSHLQTLRLNNNPQLKQLPKSIDQLAQLRVLDLTQTSIRDLRRLCQLPNLKTLYLGIGGIPIDVLANIHTLEVLYLPHHVDLIPTEGSLQRIPAIEVQEYLDCPTILSF